MVRVLLPMTLPSALTKSWIYSISSLIIPTIAIIVGMWTHPNSRKDPKATLIATGGSLIQLGRNVFAKVSELAPNNLYIHNWDITLVHIISITKGYTFSELPKPTEAIFHLLAMGNTWVLPAYINLPGIMNLTQQLMAAGGIVLSSQHVLMSNPNLCMSCWGVSSLLHYAQPFGDYFSHELSLILLAAPHYLYKTIGNKVVDTKIIDKNK